MDKVAAYSAHSEIGKFVISDPCYVLPDDIYYDIWEDVYDFKSGTIAVDESSFAVIDVPEFDIDSHDTMTGTEYMVDSGAFGVIPFELCDPQKVREIHCKVFNGQIATITQDSENETIEVMIDDKVVESFYYGYMDDADDNAFDDDFNDNEEEYENE